MQSLIVKKLRLGDRIAQLLIQPIMTAEVMEVDELSENVRWENGFVSAGIQ
ncbi:hypothetical protein GF378_00370 [Candidatus Pacearchaeota archaeon]|nr:hypothetical protein [Candidatus Pacearchaeota archaeon]